MRKKELKKLLDERTKKLGAQYELLDTLGEKYLGVQELLADILTIYPELESGDRTPRWEIVKPWTYQLRNRFKFEEIAQVAEDFRQYEREAERRKDLDKAYREIGL